ncbi:hypothetical protein GALMADRAFT_141228 [Galerina marginata CBS 339.88]|uniref:Condensation domain-containing protein n=1 Tax=Galerina marginata (strain CBS 339.88) TaxID=685588 RepID=A0A067SVF9_GALM3|nr:hypothetical protein GALMADRAFT_141228 [Galerina marginata CBS 339.88]
MYCIIFPVRGRENVYGVFMHGSHALMDPRATINAFNIMCSKMVESKPSPLEDLAWGTEWKNLPDGPVTSTGGPLPGWAERGAPLLSRYLEDQTPTLCPQRRDIADHRRNTRLIVYPASGGSGSYISCEIRRVFDGPAIPGCTSARYLQDESYTRRPAREFNYSFLHSEMTLFDAVYLSTGGVLIPAITNLSQDRIDHTLIASSLPPKEKLCAIMSSLKHQSEFFLKHGHLPHLCAAMMASNPPRTMRLVANRFTNIGVVDRIIPLEWAADGGGKSAAAHGQPLFSFRLSEWSFGVPYTELNPTTHVWTMCSRMCVQVMAADTWDEDYLQRYADEIIQQGTNLLIR